MRLRIRRLTAAALAATLATGLLGAATAVAAPADPAAETSAERSGESSAEESAAETQGRQDRSALRRAMREVTDAGVAGLQVRVHDDQGDWVGTSGVRELGRHEKVPANGRFRVGSITKTFVSTVVLQLVDEGRIGLDDPVHRHLPQFRIDPRVTVRMLLQHTSGIADYLAGDNPDGTRGPGIPVDGPEFFPHRFRTYTHADLAQIGTSQPALFEPGSKWSYSNTNYALIALLIEKTTGTPYATQVENRVLRPLGLRETSIPGTRVSIPGPHAHGYLAFTRDGKREVHDVTRLNPSWAGAAGEIISTTRDLDRFISALHNGRLLKPELLAVMRQAQPVVGNFSYGLGLEIVDFGPACGGVFYGHSGGIPGYSSYVYSTPDGSRRMELSMSEGNFDPRDSGAAQKLSAKVQNLLDAAACGKAAPSDSQTARSAPARPHRF